MLWNLIPWNRFWTEFRAFRVPSCQLNVKLGLQDVNHAVRWYQWYPQWGFSDGSESPEAPEFGWHAGDVHFTTSLWFPCHPHIAKQSKHWLRLLFGTEKAQPAPPAPVIDHSNWEMSDPSWHRKRDTQQLWDDITPSTQLDISLKWCFV